MLLQTECGADQMHIDRIVTWKVQGNFVNVTVPAVRIMDKNTAKRESSKTTNDKMFFERNSRQNGNNSQVNRTPDAYLQVRVDWPSPRQDLGVEEGSFLHSPSSASGSRGAATGYHRSSCGIRRSFTSRTPKISRWATGRSRFFASRDPSKVAFPNPLIHSKLTSRLNNSDNTKKKPKKSCRHQKKEKEVHVLKWDAKHTCLWNLKNRYFKNKAKKDRLWEDRCLAYLGPTHSKIPWNISGGILIKLTN